LTLVIPSLDIRAGRSRLVWWPGASTGSGVPTDRPDAIARALVEQGAPLIHLVDLDGAREGRPANLEAIASVARAVATPLQVAGGIDGPEQVEIAFAAGATRVVMPLWSVAEDRDVLDAALRVAGDWLAIGVDAREERLAGYPWRHRPVPGLVELVTELEAAGVRRFVLSHGGASPDLERLRRLASSVQAEIVVAGGVDQASTVVELRRAGIGAVILGEVLFDGRLTLADAIAAAAPLPT
jgi:phosphoribosylformimino-5-aminoimidazole carboxamide ribonucleotide (ProFAR) isomerase